MLASLRHDPMGEGGTHLSERYLFSFVGVLPLPEPALVARAVPVEVGMVELFQGERFLVESVDLEADPTVAVLRKVRS